MLEYTKAGNGERLAMLVLHDDADREYAYGPTQGLPDSKVGTFTQALYDEAKSKGWIVIRMKGDACLSLVTVGNCSSRFHYFIGPDASRAILKQSLELMHEHV